MTANWKKAIVIVLDLVIAAYLVLAASVFNKPAEKASVCSEVNIHIDKQANEGFLTVKEVKKLLEQQYIYPLAQPMQFISTRSIEETLGKNPFIESAECYKTQSGHICIYLAQRTPVMRVMALNGDSYYIDSKGELLPSAHYATNVTVATGNINQKYARKVLGRLGRYLTTNRFWQSQIVQVEVLGDGSIELVPRVGDHIAYLGKPVNMEHKLDRLQKFYKYGLSHAGWNKYERISVEFDNQIICKRKPEYRD
jgi:cell division protein FtsQ